MNFQQDNLASLIRLVDKEVAKLIKVRGDLVNITRMGDSIDELRAARKILANKIVELDRLGVQVARITACALRIRTPFTDKIHDLKIKELNSKDS